LLTHKNQNVCSFVPIHHSMMIKTSFISYETTKHLLLHFCITYQPDQIKLQTQGTRMLGARLLQQFACQSIHLRAYWAKNLTRHTSSAVSRTPPNTTGCRQLKDHMCYSFSCLSMVGMHDLYKVTFLFKSQFNVLKDTVFLMKSVAATPNFFLSACKGSNNICPTSPTTTYSNLDAIQNAAISIPR
jgi:hypothetical protein